ncbi:hypothetical protein [Tautonia plasticadhaerens]|uniref:Uncharacterized protein n=1 Tax=Tautonia plasticadhaerens TaxID=2527974 RepID=A0A518H257_9BACT|nr:hypothetical protein [Tautonia plasticadhaerens]QDV34926.1 hypothetical protein ElP_28230 [Tautonia plasticadhaerens]
MTDTPAEAENDWTQAKKKDLLKQLRLTLAENRQLKQSVERLMRKQGQAATARHPGHADDFVPCGWPEQHGIAIPRADGYFQSGTAWVRILHGVITHAGFKNQSILASLIEKGVLDDGSQTHASIYADWRAAFYAVTEAARYSNVGTGDPEAWSKEDRFAKLLEKIDRKDLRLVDILVSSHPTEKQVIGVCANREPFLDAFRRMADAINTINRDADEYRQNPNAWSEANREMRQKKREGINAA